MGIPWGALVTQAANAKTAFSGAKADAQRQGQDDALKNALLLMKLKQDQQNASLAQALGQSNIRANDARATAALRPPPTPNIDPNSPAGIAAAIAKATGSRPPEKPQAPILGSPEYLKAEEDLETMRAKHRPAPQDTFSPITVGGGEGQPSVIKPFNTKTGTVGEAVGEAKPAPTRIESAINTAAKARLEAAVSEMNNAHAGMDEFEKGLANKTININGLEQFLSATGSSFTHDDPASRAIQSGALAALNRTNPPLARYIRRGLSFAEGESMVSQRPSDFRTKMAAFLSTAASGASPEMIHDIQSRRTSILDPLNRNVIVPPKGGGRGNRAAPPSGNIDLSAKPATREQQLWDAAVAKHGREKVEATYGPRPE